MAASPGKGDNWRTKPAVSRGARRDWIYSDKGSAGQRWLRRAWKFFVFMVTLVILVVLIIVGFVPFIDSIPETQIVAFSLDYHAADFPRNDSGREDARLLQEALTEINPRQFHVRLCENEATAEAIRRELKPSECKGKNLVVFCSMYGRVKSDDPGQKDVSAYFYAIDAEVHRNPNSDKGFDLVRVKDFVAELVETGAKHVLLLVDAGRLRPNWRLGILANDFVEQFMREVESLEIPNLVTIVSTEPHEFSWTSTEWNADEPVKAQSVFAHFVLQGLIGDADGALVGVDGQAPKLRRGDRYVDVDELYTYVREQVARWTQEHGKPRQTIAKLGEDHFKIAAIPPSARKGAFHFGRKDPAPTDSKDHSENEAKASEKAGSENGADGKTPEAAPATQPEPADPGKVAAKTGPASSPDQPNAKKGPSKLEKLADAVLKSRTSEKEQAQLEALLKEDDDQVLALQRDLADWLVGQAKIEDPEPATFHLQPVLKLLNAKDKRMEVEQLRRFARLDESLPESGLDQRAEWGRTILRLRLRAFPLIDQGKSWPAWILTDLADSLRALVAAERWLYEAGEGSEPSQQQIVSWITRANEGLNTLRKRGQDFDKIRADDLPQKLRQELPRLAFESALNAEVKRAKVPRKTEEREAFKDFMTAATNSISELPAGIADFFEQPDQKLLVLMRRASRLKRLSPMSSEQEKEDFQDTQRIWNDVERPGDGPQIIASTDGRLKDSTGIWLGFWGIETLRFQGNEEPELVERWGDLVTAAGSDRKNHDQSDLIYRRSRLGELFRARWARLPQEQEKSSDAEQHDSDLNELKELWNQDPSPAKTLRITGRQLQKGTLQIELPEQSANGGKGQLEVRYAARDGQSPKKMRLRFFSQTAVTIHRDGKEIHDDDLPMPNEPRTYEVRLAASEIRAQSMQERWLYIELVEGEKNSAIPREIHPLRIKPPFDSREWRIEFRTVDNTTENRSTDFEHVSDGTDSRGSKLFLPPAGNVLIQPYLIGPALDGVGKVHVDVYLSTGPDGKISEPLFPGIDVNLVERANGSQHTREAALTFKPAEPAPTAGATAANASASAPPGHDLSQGRLVFKIAPEERPQFEYFVKPVLYSKDAFLVPPTPRVLGDKVVIQLNRPDAERPSPLLPLKVHAELEILEESEWRSAPLAVKDSSWQETLTAKTLETDVVQQQKRETRDQATSLSLTFRGGKLKELKSHPLLSISLAGLPHAFRWEFLPAADSIRDPVPTFKPITGEFVRIFIVDPAEQDRTKTPPEPHLWRQGRTTKILNDDKAPKIRIRTEVDAPDLDRSGGEETWSLKWEWREENAGNWVSVFDETAPSYSVQKQIAFVGVDKKGGWQIVTSVNDFEFDLPNSNNRTGKFQLRATLSAPPQAVRRQLLSARRQDTISLWLDKDPPEKPQFLKRPAAKVVLTEKAEVNFAIRVTDDPQSGLSELRAGLVPKGKKGLDETAIECPLQKPDFTHGNRFQVLKSQLPEAGKEYVVLAITKNGVGLTSAPLISDPISFEDPPPKGILVVTVESPLGADAAHVVTINGKRIGEFPLPRTFPNLSPGEYEITVTSPRGTYSGTKTVKVEKDKTTPAKVVVTRVTN